MKRKIKLLMPWILLIVIAIGSQASTFQPFPEFPLQNAANNTPGIVNFKVTGLQEGDKANATIGSNEYLDVITIHSNGTYTFKGVGPGIHSLKIEAQGYICSNPLTVEVDNNGIVKSESVLAFAITKIDPDEADSNTFKFVWEEDGSVTGYATTANINKPSQIEFLGKMIVPADVPSQQLLLNNYQMILSDDELPWTEEYAYRLLMTMRMFELPVPDNFEIENPIIKVTLADEELADDIKVTQTGKDKEVRISKHAFYYANPYFVRLDGVKGRFFSKRLHHALTELVTDYGRDIDKANEILERRFGCRITGLNYEEITRGITDETDSDFQMFVPSEIVAIINMFEELPEGYHKTDHLKYLLRRLNDRPHPLYPDAAAVSWCVDNGYIEFMERAFGGNNQQFDTQRLILHEKTHFLWHFVFNDEIKNKWIEIGQWYNDPNSTTGWFTTDQTGFVSQYAHDVNPDEDMAESVAYYLKNPEWLHSRNTAKYEFIRDYIMHGTRYITQIRPDLTFEVFNLWPDYDYPGKLIKMEMTCTGAPDEDKQLKIDIWLNHIDGCMDGAENAHTRIFSPYFYDQNGKKCCHYVENWFMPVDGDHHHLTTTMTIDKNMKSGEWTSWGINLSDAVGNERYASNIADYIWRLNINNSDEDLYSPEYVANSLRYELSEVDGEGEAEGHKVQLLRAIYKGYDDRAVTGTYMGFTRGDDAYTWAAWGRPYNDPGMEGWMHTDMIIHPYFLSGKYFASSISGSDKVGNNFFIRFPEDEPIKTIDITTAYPDREYAELDLNRISVYAEPTNPEAPNGETIVTLSFFTRDNISGLDGGEIKLRDPQGGVYSLFFSAIPGHSFYDGNPTEWAHHTQTTILPVGSAPGIWGVESIFLRDKAGNERTYSFIETLIFEPDDDESSYVLFTELNKDILTIHLEAIDGHQFGYEYRIIHEQTGQEIAGVDNNGPNNMSTMRRISGDTPTRVNVSSLPDGDLIVITNIFDSNGKIENSKSARINKETPSEVEQISPNDLKITVNERMVSIVSPTKSFITISTIDGRSVTKTIYEGVNHFTLPDAGFYIIGDKKILIR